MKTVSPESRRTRVLIVDDEPNLTTMFKVGLERTGEYEVVAVNNPTEVLRILKAESFAVIILDLVMPYLSGSEVANSIRESGINTPMFFFSGAICQLQVPVLIQDESGDYYLAKPVTLETLRNAIIQITTAKSTIPRISKTRGPANIPELTKDVLSDTSAAFLHKLTSLFNKIMLLVENERRLINDYAPAHGDLVQAHEELAITLDAMLHILKRFRNTLGRHPGVLNEIELQQLLKNVCHHLDNILPGGIIQREDPEEYRLNGDYELLWHLFENLIRNALEAIRDRDYGHVKINTWIQEGDVLISILDNGCGIAPEVLGRIFELNYTTKPGGLGIGLYLAHRAATFHGGHISCRSAQNVGTEFTVTLPLVSKDKSQ